MTERGGSPSPPPCTSRGRVSVERRPSAAAQPAIETRVSLLAWLGPHGQYSGSALAYGESCLIQHRLRLVGSVGSARSAAGSGPAPGSLASAGGVGADDPELAAPADDAAAPGQPPSELWSGSAELELRPTAAPPRGAAPSRARAQQPQAQRVAAAGPPPRASDHSHSSLGDEAPGRGRLRLRRSAGGTARPPADGAAIFGEACQPVERQRRDQPPAQGYASPGERQPGGSQGRPAGGGQAGAVPDPDPAGRDRPRVRRRPGRARRCPGRSPRGRWPSPEPPGALLAAADVAEVARRGHQPGGPAAHFRPDPRAARRTGAGNPPGRQRTAPKDLPARAPAPRRSRLSPDTTAGTASATTSGAARHLQWLPFRRRACSGRRAVGCGSATPTASTPTPRTPPPMSAAMVTNRGATAGGQIGAAYSAPGVAAVRVSRKQVAVGTATIGRSARSARAA